MKLLIADDDTHLRTVLATELCEDQYSVEQADCGAKVLDMVKKNDFDVILLDLNLPDIRGQSVLRKIKSLEIPVEVVILTGFGSIESAVEMIKLGAYDYVTKPYELKKLISVIEKAGERKDLLQENQKLKTQIKKWSNGHKFITKNPLLLSLLENVKDFAKSDYPVMLLGETGVGKELLAEELHKASDRANGPFIPVNCGAIPENMIESELFGHEKGSFTSAHARKLGLLEIANNGTLFLDEIGDFPCDFQHKILRVLDSKRFFRIGGVKQIEVDVRIVSATNKDIKLEMEQGTFRQDLYYRLTTLMLNLPPLRSRKEDIPYLTDNIIENMSDSKMRSKRFSKQAMDILQNYRWPGNIRELQNVIHRTLLLSNGKDIIHPEDLPADLLSDPGRKKRSLQDVERHHILAILKEVNGKKSEAAKILGIDPKTLYRKLLSLNDHHA